MRMSRSARLFSNGTRKSVAKRSKSSGRSSRFAARLPAPAPATPGVGRPPGLHDLLVLGPIGSDQIRGQPAGARLLGPLDDSVDLDEQPGHLRGPVLPTLFGDPGEFPQVVRVAQRVRDVVAPVGLPPVVHGDPGGTRALQPRSSPPPHAARARCKGKG